MADDGVIRIGTSVDVSGIQEGMQEAQAVVAESTSEMSSAYERLAGATAEYSVTSANLRAVIAQVVSGQVPYQLATQALTPALLEQAAASTALREAKSALITAEVEETAAVRGTISARMAATAEMRVLEGNIMGSTRAAGTFLTMIPGMSAALEVAFPIFGAIALAGVLVEVGSKAKDLYDEFATLKVEGEDLAKGLAEDGDRIAKSWGETLSILHSTGMRDNPVGTLKQDIADVALSIQGLQAKSAYMKRDLVDAFSVRAGGNYYGHGTSEEGNDQRIQGDQSRLREYEQKITELQAKSADLQSEADKKQDSGPAASGPNPQIQQMRDLEAEFGRLNAAKSEISGHGLSAGEGASFWAQYLSTFTAGSDQAKKVLADYTKYQEEMHKQLRAGSGSGQELSTSGVDKGMQDMSAALQRQGEDVMRSGERWNGYNAEMAKGQEAQAQATQAVSLANIAAEEASGAITKLSGDQQIAAMHAADYAAKLKALREELARLQAQQKIDPTTGANTDPKNAQQQAQVQNQITQVQGQAKASGISDQSNINQQIAQPYLKAFDQINSGWLEVQNRMLMSTRNLGLAFAEMGQHLLTSVMDSGEKAVLVAAEHDLMMLVHHQATNQLQVGSDATKAAESGSIDSASALKKMFLDETATAHHIASNVAQVASDAWGSVESTAVKLEQGVVQRLDSAKTAFSNTYAQVSAWPVVGTFLAPVLASAAFAGAAAFETGTGYVPHDGYALIHQGEAVIPAPTMQELRGSNTNGSGDVNITQHNNWNASSNKEFQRQLYANAQHVAGAVQKHVRQRGH